MAKLKTQPEINKLASELQDRKKSSAYLEEMRQLAEDPEYQRSTPPESQQALKDALNRAEQAYQEKANRNEWLEVAQTLGQAITRFGAAQSGMRSGRDMSNIQMTPGIDYGARTDRAFKEMTTQQRNAADEADRSRQEYLDTEKAKDENYGKREGYLRGALKTAQEAESDDLRYQRQLGMDARRAKEETARVDNTNKQLEYKDLDRQSGELRKQLAAAQESSRRAVNQLASEGISAQDAKKNEIKYQNLLADAGLSPDAIAEAEKEAQVPGRLWGTNTDKKVMATKLQEKAADSPKIQEIKSMLQAIESRKANILSGGQPAQPMRESPSPAPAANPGIVRVKYKGQILEIPQESLKEAQADGAELVK